MRKRECGFFKFCSKCGTELAKESNGGENTKEVLSNVNQAGSDKKKVNLSKKNKMILAGIVGLLLIVGGIFLIYNNYKSKNVLMSQIENDLIGETFYVGQVEVKLTKKNIKDIDVKEKSTKTEYGINYYTAKGTLKVKEDKYNLEVPIEMGYYKITNKSNLSSYLSESDTKDVNTKTWYKQDFHMDTNSDEMVLKIDEELTDDKIKELIVKKGVEGSKITKKMLENAKLKKGEAASQGTNYSVTGTITSDYSILKTNKDITADFAFDGKAWKCSSISVSSMEIEECDKVDASKALKGLTSFLGSNEISLSSDYSSIGTIKASDITEFEFIDIDTKTGYWSSYKELLGNVKGSKDKASFEGYITVTIYSDGSMNAEISADTLTVEKPSLDEIKNTLKGEKIYCKVNDKSTTFMVDETASSSFVLDEVINDKDYANKFYVFGTMSYKGIENDKMYIKLEYNLTDNKWEVITTVTASYNSYFDEDYNKEDYR